MNIAAILAALVHMHVCAANQFQAPDGSSLAVVVCPVMTAPDAPADKPADPLPEGKGPKRNG